MPEKRTAAEKFVYDFMLMFDENGLATSEEVMYLRAYSKLKELRQMKIDLFQTELNKTKDHENKKIYKNSK